MKFCLLTFLVFLVPFTVLAAQPDFLIATYTDGQSNHQVRLGDITNSFSVLFSDTDNLRFLEDETLIRDYIFNDFIFPKLVLMDYRGQSLPEAGLTDEWVEDRIRLLVLYNQGAKKLNEEALLYRYDLVRVSIINFHVNTVTNDNNGFSVSLQENVIKKSFEDAQSKAEDILAKLRKSRNLAADFSNLAAGYSDDASGYNKSGDLGYFVRGMMDPDFEDAVFKMGKNGLIPNAVRTQNGVYVVMITALYNNLTLKEMEKLAGPDHYYALKTSVITWYLRANLEKNIVPYYKDLALTSNLNGCAVHSAADLKPDDVLLKINGKDHYWKDIYRTVKYFVPEFETNASLNDLDSQCQNYASFIQLVNKAGADYQKSAEFRNDFQKQLSGYYETKAMEKQKEELWIKAQAMVTDHALRELYELNRKNPNMYIKSRNEEPSSGYENSMEDSGGDPDGMEDNAMSEERDDQYRDASDSDGYDESDQDSGYEKQDVDATADKYRDEEVRDLEEVENQTSDVEYMTFEEALPEVRKELEEKYFDTLYSEWKKNAMKRYRVKFENGWREKLKKYYQSVYKSN